MGNEVIKSLESCNRKHLTPGKFAGGLASSVVLGGTASVIGGGKFANGAKAAAFAYLFNEAAHAAASYADKIFEALKNLRSWKAGTGPSVQYFGPGSIMSDGMKDSLGATRMRNLFYEENAKGRDSIDHVSYQWPNNFVGLYRILRAGLDGVEQQVGSWGNGTVNRYGDTLVFRIENPMTNESFYRPPNDFLQSTGLSCLYPGQRYGPTNTIQGPQKNVLQVIWWHEPYRPPVSASAVNWMRGISMGLR